MRRVSIAPAIEMQMRHGMPPLQTALDHGIQPSLSVDVECNMTADMFSIMRAAFTLQRALANERSLAGEQNLAPLLTCRQVIEMATIGGARAAHLDSKVGTLSPGKEADIIMLAADRINVFPLNNVPGTVVAVFFVAFSVSGLTLAGAAPWVNQVFNGAALIVAVTLSTLAATGGRNRVAGRALRSALRGRTRQQAE